MRGQAAISSIYRRGPDLQLSEQAERQRVQDVKRDAWLKFGLLMIDPEDINNDLDRQHAINIGNQHYGRRGRRG